MIVVNKPTEFNGKQFGEEIGVSYRDIVVIGDEIHIDTTKTKKQIEDALAKHIPVNEPITIIDKLNKAGIDLDELRVALGL